MIRSAREGVPDDAVNLHATAVVLDDAAVMITGCAGAGKTHLALCLLEHWRATGRYARLLADDQVFVMRRGDRLVAQAPKAIEGLAEVRGVGIVEVPWQPVAAIDLVVHLDEDVTTISTLSTVQIEAVELPRLLLGCRDSERSRPLVAATLEAVRSAPKPENAAIMLASDNDLGLPSRDGRTT